MKKLLFLILSFFSASAEASHSITLYDTNTTNYFQMSASETMKSTYKLVVPDSPGTAGQTLVVNSVSGNRLNLGFAAGSGSSSSALQVQVNGVQVSSPTASINFSSAFLGNENPAGTANISINSSSITAQGVLVAGSNITLTPGSGQTVISANGGSGGGGSSLEVFNNFNGSRSSPTASIGMSNAFAGSVSGSTYTFALNSASATLQGNAFNGANQLVQLNGSTQLPAVSAANLTNIPSANLTGLVPNSSIDSSSVTKQGNTFNGNNQLLQLDGSSLVPSANIPTTLSAYIQNRNTLQSGATAYPSFIYVGSSGSFSGPVIIVATTSTNALKILANGTYGTSAGSSGGFLIDCTGGGGSSGMCAQFYTNASTQAALGGIVNVIQDLAGNTWNQPGIYVKMNSTNGSAANARFDGPVPQIEWVETDQVSPAGKYEDGVNGDVRYIAGRKGDNSQFDDFLEMARKDAAGGGYIMIVSTQTPLRFHDAGTHFVSFRSSNTVAANVAWVLPSSDGGANTTLQTDGSGNLFFAPVSSLTASGVTAGTYGSQSTVATFTVTAQGIVTGASAIPILISTSNLSATGATSSNFLRGDNTWATPAGGGGTNNVSSFTYVFRGETMHVLGSSQPFISFSTGETAGAVYFDEAVVNAVTMTTDLKNYLGNQLFVDAIFTSTATSGTVNWGTYVECRTPNTSTVDFDSDNYGVLNSSSVTLSGTSNAVKRAVITLSNLSSGGCANGDIITLKVTREAITSDTAVGFAKLRFIRLYE